MFFYGTLKRGHANHDLYCRGYLHALEATVRGRLYHLPSGYPALVVPEDDPGERLPALDRLEGFVPAGQSLYRRVLIPAETSGGDGVLAWAYVIEGTSGTCLPGGSWPP